MDSSVPFDRLVSGPDPTRLRGLLPSNLDVAGLASRSVAEFAAAINSFLVASDRAPRQWNLDADRIAASYGSDRLLRQNGEPVSMFAPLSGFFRTNDGWIRTHANYPHHRLRLCSSVGLPPEANASDFAAAVATRDAQSIEDAAWPAGALAVRVRTPPEWTMPQAPVVTSMKLPEKLRGARGAAPDSSLPLAGIRVLDLTRVIAGPVATRTLALLGADVLRVDPPLLPEPPLQHVDTGQGKRSTLIDASAPGGRDILNGLLERADVVVGGYRPGSLERLGLTLPAGIVHATVDAWGSTPGWQGRRGFDSLVQAATGISMIESTRDESDSPVPGALPVQALDHSAGYLLAAAVVRALAAQIHEPEGWRISVSLSNIAALLRERESIVAKTAGQTIRADVMATHGDFTTARPAFAEFDDYEHPAHELGGDAPEWR